jgi:sarcosine oxidase gamma subunit
MNEHAGMKRVTLPRILVLVLIGNATRLVILGPDDFFVRNSVLENSQDAEAQAQRHHENDRVNLSHHIDIILYRCNVSCVSAQSNYEAQGPQNSR